jgi:UDP-N-acetylmuramoyl-tripeptide--D-alanyl-D-alanine ligase
VLAAIDLLSGLPGRRIAVLGEMLELGQASDMGHRAVGRAAAPVCDLLVAIGAGGVEIAVGAREAGLPANRLYEAPDQEAALELLRPRLRPGDVVLVKASRGIALDRLVERLRDELGPPRRGAER